MKRALIVWGGWDGHEPEPVAELFATMLRAEGWEADVRDTLDAFRDLDLKSFDLIVPIWTMGEIRPDQREPVVAAVKSGVGLAGCHGGMCDAFRSDTEWQFMAGGQWVAHPGNDGVRYTVHLESGHPVTIGLPESFEVVSEQYYMHTDPGNRVIGWTEFPHPEHGGPHTENPCRMPQVWTKMYGAGKVFYSAIGHQRKTIEEPVPREIMRRGFLWAARSPV